ncbi:MAG: transcription-repair coupling factor [Chloroflexi bacterium RBG_16_50_11]|nr:MAG: transcription-repair coupling factor [Chloroflexi bacterium RBG_16_50_11]
MPELSRLLQLIEPVPAYRRLLGILKQGKAGRIVVLDAARPYLVAALYENLQMPVLLITAQPEHAKKLHEQLSSWSRSKQIYLFPEPDVLPYERLTPDTTTEIERIQVLSALAGCSDGENNLAAPLVVASAAALMSRTTARNDFVASRRAIKLGMAIEPFRLLADLSAMGYQLENIVEVPGAMSHRGGIIDVYPPTRELPVRLEFFGDSIDSMRSFDPATQRSIENIPLLDISPATELLAPGRIAKTSLEDILNSLDLTGCTAEVKQQFQRDKEIFLGGQLSRETQFYAPLFDDGKILDYLPAGALIVLDEPSSIAQSAAEFDAEAAQLRSEKLERGELPRNFPTPYFIWDELEPLIKIKQNLSLEAWGIEEGMDFISPPGYAGKLTSFITKTTELLGQQKRIIIVSHQANRLAELFDEKGIIVAPTEAVSQLPEPGNMVLVQGSLPEGWVMGGDTYLFTDAEIFGFVKQRRLVKKRPAARHKLTLDFVPDDYVVHVEHGIGKFTGVTMLNTTGSDKEYLVLQYAGNDILYVPTDQIDRVSRYVGAGDRTPVLSRLGTQEWVRTRQKAKEAAELLARDLLNLYATREVVTGFAFSRDTVWQQELEAAFPYVETPDQLEAQRDVKEDMEKPKPMDRLVCGDVGYGKTEVAIRAAFKAVMDGRQVAVLVPTTVLAQQHYATFSERLEAFPVKVEVLSRFRSDREQRNVIAGLTDGTVDICIGTHRLIQKDVIFKNLGLLIIDEEQRFGVNHKEYLKKMRREVDVLTLSATPIPRTLHMSLVGVRDMSTMETPPEARLPVKTYVAEYNDHLVREAILRELERNGQVFFVHNRVQSIAMIAENLRNLVPEAQVAVGHGQMPEDELENVMTAFSQGKVDILVCTTIIESGLDMPNANTIIINKADKFGLTQLYQLRGRVGRGANLAYAYFLYDGGKRLTPVAHKRLRTIYEATELGAGFGIAMKDLEIRGAGTLLGHKQSGHITAIGFSLYTRLLADAVEEQKAIMAGKEKPPPRLPPPAIDLPLDAFIPASYVSDVDTRLELYRTLGNIESAAKLDDILKEYTDRFGAPPPEVHNLFFALKIKDLAARAGIESITTEEGNIVLRRFQGVPFDAQRFMQALTDGVTVGRTQIRIDYKKQGQGWRVVLERVIRGLLTY